MPKLKDLLSVGRVVSEDDKWILLEIPKDEDEPYTLQGSDIFYTIMFVKVAQGARLYANDVMPWKPWEHA